MTTTACDDQFSRTTERHIAMYSIESILRRNVADLEIALKQQTERAEAADEKLTTAREDMQSWIDSRNGWMERAGAAEAELAKLRKQKPVAWINLNKWTPSNGPRCVTPEEYEKELELLTKLTAVYAAPVPALAVLAPPTPFIPDDDTRRNDAEFAAQQAATAPSVAGCRTCANRGRINGLSQESYCDSCIYQGRDWRQNHFVLAVKRRCEACAVLPCSCE